jgi:phosphatidate cytidylyltransferase
MTSQFKQRLLVGSFGVLFLAIIIYFSHTPFFKPIFALISAAIITFALLEYYQLAQNKGMKPLTNLGINCTIVYVIAVYLGTQYSNLAYLSSFTLFGSLFLFFLSFFKSQANPLVNLAVTVFGLAYVTIPLSFIIKLNYFSSVQFQYDGRIWLVYVLAITKMTDIGAYFFGKTMGKRKLAPHISPQKTVEGAVGGLLSAVVTSILFAFYINWMFPNLSSHMNGWQSIVIGFLISLSAQFGDLAESILKRDARVKDSSRLPGLGGMLDIVDSLVFTLPLMYFILKMGLLYNPT